MMPAGQYYVGDLCYVMHNEWDEVCGLLFEGRDDHGCNEGEFNLADGRRFAMLNTAYGDGEYYDQYGKSYGVDAGSIGCIRVKDITDEVSSDDLKRYGNLVTFNEPFDIINDQGVIVIGHIAIDTDPKDDWNDMDYEEDVFNEWK